jgi:ABC-type branched-subunit amino acid transport system ATPase component
LIHESGVAMLLVDRSVAAVTDVADCIVILVKGEKVFEGARLS